MYDNAAQKARVAELSEALRTPYGRAVRVTGPARSDGVVSLSVVGSKIRADIEPDGGAWMTWADGTRVYSATSKCEDCNGEGEIVLNPDWPQGDTPYSEKCSSCGGTGKAV